MARLTGWTDKIWARRYNSIPVSEEEASQVARLRYLLSHAVKEFNARLRREDFEPRKYASAEPVILSPLPCWKHLEPQAYRARIAEIFKEIESAARQERKEKRIEPLGAKAILVQNPQDSPAEPKKSPAPLFHVFKKVVRTAMWEAYAMFVAAFQEAAEKLRAGDPTARFPVGSFPPHLPFVSSA